MGIADGSFDNQRGPDGRALGETNDAKAQRIIFRIFEEMEQEKAEKGSYYALVPEILRPVVDRLVERYYPEYGSQFQDDKSAFQEKMSQNWVAKFRAFPRLAQTMGYVNLSGMPSIPGQFLSDSIVTCLTVNSSYVFIGPGAYGSAGAGAAMDYKRLPLRQESAVRDETHDAGVFFKEPPAMLAPLSLTGASSLITSPVLAIWIKPVERLSEEDRATFHETMTSANETINGATFFGG